MSFLLSVQGLWRGPGMNTLLELNPLFIVFFMEESLFPQSQKANL